MTADQFATLGTDMEKLTRELASTVENLAGKVGTQRPAGRYVQPAAAEQDDRRRQWVIKEVARRKLERLESRIREDRAEVEMMRDKFNQFAERAMQFNDLISKAQGAEKATALKQFTDWQDECESRREERDKEREAFELLKARIDQQCALCNALRRDMEATRIWRAEANS